MHEDLDVVVKTVKGGTLGKEDTVGVCGIPFHYSDGSKTSETTRGQKPRTRTMLGY